MGNCPACLSGRYSIHDMVSEERDEIGELGSSNGGIKVVRVTDGKVFEYKTTSGRSDGDDDVDDRHMQHLRAKDVISMVQGAEESSNLLYALFDQSYSMASTDMIRNSSTGRNEKVKRKMQHYKKEKSEEKGYDSKPLHPETLLKISHVYYLLPASAATTANYDHNILSSVSCPANAQAAAAIKPATDKKKRKKVRFSDHVVFIEPPAPSSRYTHHRQHLDCIHSPPTKLAAVLPNLAAAPLSKVEKYMAQADNIVGRDDDDDDGAPIDECQLGAAKGPVVRVKLLLSKRQLCDLLAATGQYQQELKHHHSQSAAPDGIAEKLAVATWLPPHLAEQLVSCPPPSSSLLSPTNNPIY